MPSTPNQFPNKTPHYPTKECSHWHCYSCNIDEPKISLAYKICFECGHVYSEWGLIQSYTLQTGQKLKASEIYYCPLCAHDF